MSPIRPELGSSGDPEYGAYDDLYGTKRTIYKEER